MNTKKIFVSIILVLIVMTCLGINTSAHTVQIKGPSTVTVTAGIVKKVKYYIYVDGVEVSENDDVVSYSETPDVAKTSKYIDAHYDSESPNNFYFLAQKAKTQTVILSTSVSFDGYGNTFKKVSKKVKVKVKKNPSICLGGGIIDYSTRNSAFSVLITNYASKPITIMPEDAKALNYHYKMHDRKLHLSNNASITIPAGAKKKVKFICDEMIPTWESYIDYLIKCKAVYKGKTYDLKITPAKSPDGYGGIVKVKINGKWKKTLKEKL